MLRAQLVKDADLRLTLTLTRGLSLGLLGIKHAVVRGSVRNERLRLRELVVVEWRGAVGASNDQVYTFILYRTGSARIGQTTPADNSVL